MTEKLNDEIAKPLYLQTLETQASLIRFLQAEVDRLKKANVIKTARANGWHFSEECSLYIRALIIAAEEKFDYDEYGNLVDKSDQHIAYWLDSARKELEAKK